MLLRVTNWRKFQHYHDRNPPWIKLATGTFQNYEFSRLHDASKLLAVCIWTLAARSSDGSVPDDLDFIKQMGCLGQLIKAEHLKQLIDQGFITRCSEPLATRSQVAALEREGEVERETEGEKIPALSPPGSTPAHVEPYVMPIPFIELTTNTGRPWAVYAEMVAEWQALFPSVDVEQALRSMKAWADASPANRKTDGGMRKFIVGWLGRDHNRGGNVPRGTRPNGGAAVESADDYATRIAAEMEKLERDRGDKNAQH